MKSLDLKLAHIHADPAGARDFILADAKDADVAWGLAATGVNPATGRLRSLADYRDQMREIVRQGLVDIMLMSVSTSELLTVREGLFEDSHVTPAVRANDSTDIHLVFEGAYAEQPSQPFRTPTVAQVVGAGGADVCLYSITLNNDATLDRATLEAYRDFRLEAEPQRLRHFLEVFDPNAPGVRRPHRQVLEPAPWIGVVRGHLGGVARQPVVPAARGRRGPPGCPRSPAGRPGEDQRGIVRAGRADQPLGQERPP